MVVMNFTKLFCLDWGQSGEVLRLPSLMIWKNWVPTSGLSLRAEGLGFPLATTNVGPSYFHKKIGEK